MLDMIFFFFINILFDHTTLFKMADKISGYLSALFSGNIKTGISDISVLDTI